MKKITILLICIFAAVTVFAGCSSDADDEAAVEAVEIEETAEDLVDETEVSEDSAENQEAYEEVAEEQEVTEEQSEAQETVEEPAATETSEAPAKAPAETPEDRPERTDDGSMPGSMFAEYVESGLLTEDEATALEEYFMENMPLPENGEQAISEEMENPLDAAVEDGIITQEQADSIDMEALMAGGRGGQPGGGPGGE